MAAKNKSADVATASHSQAISYDDNSVSTHAQSTASVQQQGLAGQGLTGLGYSDLGYGSSYAQPSLGSAGYG